MSRLSQDIATMFAIAGLLLVGAGISIGVVVGYVLGVWR